MTRQANVVLSARRLVTKRKHVIESAAGADVLCDVAVAVQAPESVPSALLPLSGIEKIVRIAHSRLELVTVTGRA